MNASGDNEDALTLAWNIATQPNLYRELAQNPYSKRTAELWQRKFPDSNSGDLILGIILSEPEGFYDKDFKRLELSQQEEVLQKQKLEQQEKTQQISDYVSVNAYLLAELPLDWIYTRLTAVIFEETDAKEIEKTFSRTQRLEFKLLVRKHIEEIESLRLVSNIPKLKLIETQLKQTARSPVWQRVFLHKPTLLIIACASPSLIFVSFLAVGFLGKKPVEVKIPSATLGVETKKQTQGIPLRLQIPSIEIDTAVEYMGIDEKGQMEVPKSTSNVGWYKLGPRPGEIGSAVVSGHFDESDGKSGVFNKLSELKPGDKLFVFSDIGSVSTFVVREARMYKPGYAEDVFLSQDGVAHLNLVTCDGVWDDHKKSYTKRLVVFTDML